MLSNHTLPRCARLGEDPPLLGHHRSLQTGGRAGPSNSTTKTQKTNWVPPHSDEHMDYDVHRSGDNRHASRHECSQLKAVADDAPRTTHSASLPLHNSQRDHLAANLLTPNCCGEPSVPPVKHDCTSHGCTCTDGQPTIGGQVNGLTALVTQCPRPNTATHLTWNS